MCEKDIFSLIDRDPNFAEQIDQNCYLCQQGMGNQRQQSDLANRGILHPREQRITKLLQQKCENCNGNVVENISSLHSCLWR